MVHARVVLPASSNEVEESGERSVRIGTTGIEFHGKDAGTETPLLGFGSSLVANAERAAQTVWCAMNVETFVGSGQIRHVVARRPVVLIAGRIERFTVHGAARRCGASP